MPPAARRTGGRGWTKQKGGARELVTKDKKGLLGGRDILALEERRGRVLCSRLFQWGKERAPVTDDPPPRLLDRGAHPGVG